MTRVSSKSISKPHSSKPAAKPAKKPAATKKPAAKAPRHADKFEASGRGKRTNDSGRRYAIIDRSSTSSTENANLRHMLDGLGGGGRSSGGGGYGGGGYGGGGSGS